MFGDGFGVDMIYELQILLETCYVFGIKLKFGLLKEFCSSSMSKLHTLLLLLVLDFKTIRYLIRRIFASVDKQFLFVMNCNAKYVVG